MLRQCPKCEKWNIDITGDYVKCLSTNCDYKYNFQHVPTYQEVDERIELDRVAIRDKVTTGSILRELERVRVHIRTLPSSRETSLAITKIDECYMWLERM